MKKDKSEPKVRKTPSDVTRAVLFAWKQASEGHLLTDLMAKVFDTIRDVSKNAVPPRSLENLACRIARPSENRGSYACLAFVGLWGGDWEVRNQDLAMFTRFTMLLYKQAGHQTTLMFTHQIDEALRLKRLSQAKDRFTKSGLTSEHCRLLANMSWHMDTQRGPVTSLHVKGHMPFGNQFVVGDIYQHAQWEVKDWPSEGPTETQQERAWNLFDELCFAAPEVANRSLMTLVNLP